MFFLNLVRILKLGIKNFWRNIWLSVATVLVMCLALLTISILSFLNIIADTAIKNIEQRIDITVYFKEAVKEEEALALQTKLAANTLVSEVRYISETEALQKFEQRYQNDLDISTTLRELGSNPLSKSLIIKAEKIENYEQVVAGLEGDKDIMKIIKEINYQDNREVISRLTVFKTAIRRAGLAVSGFLGIIAVLVTFNTVRLTIYSRRREIGIMKLVGASNWYIRWPLFIEGVLYGLVSAVLAMFILYPLLAASAPKVDAYFTGLNFDLMSFFLSNFWQIIGLEMLVGIGLGAVSSFIAVRRYLRV